MARVVFRVFLLQVLHCVAETLECIPKRRVCVEAHPFRSANGPEGMSQRVTLSGIVDLDIHRQTNCSSKRSLRQAGAPARLRLQVLFKESEECRYNGVPILGRCCLVIDDRDESVTRGNDLGPDLRLLPEFGAQTE